jgi:AcrR family transcriptional regulator
MPTSLALREPAQKRSAETLGRLLSAAEAAFSERGFAAARLSDIAADAGVTVGAVYARFRDKEALFDAVLRRFHEASVSEVKAYFAAAAQSGVGAYDGVRRFVIGTGLTFVVRQGVYRAIIERGLTEPAIWIIPTQMRVDSLRIVIDFLNARGIAFSPDDIRAKVAQQMMYGYLLISLLNPNSPVQPNDRTALSQLADAVCHQLGLSPAAQSHAIPEVANAQL